MTETLNAKAKLLRSLQKGAVLILPNAWDAASAAMIAAAGAPAIATTSGGVSWALGRTDGQGLTRDEMTDAIRHIVSVVDIPVTADVEAGYGPAPADVAATVDAVLRAGGAGINLEDSQAPGGPLFDTAVQAERIRAGRTAAIRQGVPDFVINARTDVFLFQVGDPACRLAEVTARALAYAEAGADCVFVPGLLDLTALRSLAAALPVPVNAMAVPGGPTVAELRAAGIRRISIGTAIAQAAYTAARKAAEELLSSGTYTSLDGAQSFAELNALFTSLPR